MRTTDYSPPVTAPEQLSSPGRTEGKPFRVGWENSMNVKTGLVLVLKLAGLSVLLFICFAVASAVLPPSDAAPQSPEEAAVAALALLVVCVLDTAVLAYIVLRSRWTGWRLIATVFLAYFGTTTVMSQIESAVFITHLPEGFLPRLVLMGALVAALFAPLAVFLLGKGRGDTADERALAGPAMPASEWAWRLAVIAVVYVVLYFTFGYYVALRSPAVLEYYGLVDSGSFLTQMGTVLRDTPWLPALQVLRAMMWALLALPVIRMMKGGWWEAGLAVALLFSVVMNAQLLLPNPYMPEAVRMAHLAETASSNFIFGWAVAWLLRKNTEPASPT
jgi:hypothetical protein